MESLDWTGLLRFCEYITVHRNWLFWSHLHHWTFDGLHFFGVKVLGVNFHIHAINFGLHVSWFYVLSLHLFSAHFNTFRLHQYKQPEYFDRHSVDAHYLWHVIIHFEPNFYHFQYGIANSCRLPSIERHHIHCSDGSKC
ncbi:hypothetical protein NpNSSI1_00008255 [Neofusicoccum parvum]|nr:hypothetical protein NpNSSI1_00008255 [Neofusicoccum parvum]